MSDGAGTSFSLLPLILYVLRSRFSSGRASLHFLRKGHNVTMKQKQRNTLENDYRFIRWTGAQTDTFACDLDFSYWPTLDEACQRRDELEREQ